MPKLDWLKNEFHYGYDSGNILSLFSNKERRKEEKAIGGNYKYVFNKAVCPYLTSNAKVMELGPGKGSWSKAILKYLPKGELTTVDFQDASKWIRPERFGGRLKCIQVNNNRFDELPDNYFDFFWSFGVLCHNNKDSIQEILKNTIRKMKHGAMAVHQYGDWDKLEKYGWKKGAVPTSFKDIPDDEIWWPRNSQKDMIQIAEHAGWTVITADLNIIKRDSIIVLKKPS